MPKFPVNEVSHEVVILGVQGLIQVVSQCHGQNRGRTGPRPCPQSCWVWVEDVRDEEDDRDSSYGYEYGAYYSSSKNGKKIFEVDQNQSSMKL